MSILFVWQTTSCFVRHDTCVQQAIGRAEHIKPSNFPKNNTPPQTYTFVYIIIYK